MTPDERQLLSGLFDRMHGQANQPRDREAESFIADRVRQQPYAAYLLSQTVIVQEQALRAAAEKIQHLEEQVQGGGSPREEPSFLGGLGRSIFGGGPSPQARQAAPGAAWNQGSGYPPQQAGGPWGQQAPGGWGQGAAPQGGGFLRGALGAAAGVAGGVLAADALRGLFGGHNNPFGIASGTPGVGGETIVNNYYGDEGGAAGGGDLAAQDAQQDFLQDQADDFAGGDSGDDSYV